MFCPQNIIMSYLIKVKVTKTMILKNKYSTILHIHNVMNKKDTPMRIQIPLLILFSLFAINYSYSQSVNENNFYQLTGESINESRLNNLSVLFDSDNSLAINLVYKIHPRISVTDNIITRSSVPGDPISLTTDLNSFDTLCHDNNFFKNVIMITIKVKNSNDLNKVLDFSNIVGFDNLKYIYIDSTVPCIETEIRSLVKNPNENVTVLYKVTKTS